MEHRDSHEIPSNARLECGAVTIDVHDIGGVVDILQEAVSGTVIVARHFDAIELPSVLESELSILTSAQTNSEELRGSIGYLMDGHGDAQQDLFAAMTHLVERHGYPEESFQPIARLEGGYLLAHELTSKSIVSIILNEENSSQPGGRLKPGRVYAALPYNPDLAHDELQPDVLEFLQLWGDLHDAISSRRRPRHAIRPDSPAVISIKDIRLSDDMLMVVSVMTEYEAEREASSETWPTLAMDTVDVAAVVALIGNEGAAPLRHALRTLAGEYRLLYGRTGIMPTIDGHLILQALARIKTPETDI